MQTGAFLKQRTLQAGSGNLILHSKLITFESFWLVPTAPLMLPSCCLLSPVDLWARSPHTSPSCSTMKLPLLKLNFVLMEHPGTENYFSRKETDFGLKTAGGILSVTECSTSSAKNGFFPSQRLPTCERNCWKPSSHQKSISPCSAPTWPQGVCPSCFLPFRQSIIYPRAHSVLCPKEVSPFSDNR